MPLSCAVYTSFPIFDNAGWNPWDYGQALAAQRMVRSLSDLGVAVTILPSWLPHMLLVDEFVTDFKHHREASRAARRQLQARAFDFVFCPENILPLAFLDTDVPVCLWTDAPYIAQTDDDYLKYLDRNTGKTCALNELLRQEKEVLAACTLPAFASEWAVSSTQPYRITHAKAVPWGGSLEPTISLHEVSRALEARDLRHVHLLFLGVNWERKRGDFCVEIVKRLNDAGQPATLTIIGCTPELDPGARALCDVIGFLDPQDPQQRRRLESALLTSHFLVMPSAIEMYGVVFCEASLHGLPSLAGRVGGISTIIQDGINGGLLSAHASPHEYADRILQIISEPAGYQQLTTSTLAHGHAQLKWDVRTRAFLDQVQQALG